MQNCIISLDEQYSFDKLQNYLPIFRVTGGWRVSKAHELNKPKIYPGNGKSRFPDKFWVYLIFILKVARTTGHRTEGFAFLITQQFSF
jgi:hypothetical protein